MILSMDEAGVCRCWYLCGSMIMPIFLVESEECYLSWAPETVTGDRHQLHPVKLNRTLRQKLQDDCCTTTSDSTLPNRSRNTAGWNRYHWAHSSNIVSLNFHLFWSIQSDLSGELSRKCQNMVCEWTNLKEPEFFPRGIHLLPKRWEKMKSIQETRE